MSDLSRVGRRGTWERAGVVARDLAGYAIFGPAFASKVAQLELTSPPPPPSPAPGAEPGGKPARAGRPATSWAVVAFGLGLLTFVVVLAAVSLVAYLLPDQLADIMGSVRWAFAAVAGLALTLLGYVKGPQFLGWLGKLRGK